MTENGQDQVTTTAAGRGYLTKRTPNVGREYVAPARTAPPCRHCGSVGLDGDDHTCPCPYSDADCPTHPDGATYR